jgi:hypothetical protein
MTEQEKILFAEWIIRYYPQVLVDNFHRDDMSYAYVRLNYEYSVMRSTYDELYKEWSGEQE